MDDLFFIQETILLVDDAPENISLMSSLLKPKYRVLAANNGATALKILNSNESIDLIVLDIIMPEMNGYEVCNAIKSNPTLKEIPILFSSSLSNEADIVKAFQSGAVDYVTKPYQRDEFLARIETHLELRKAKSEIQTLLSKTLLGSIKLLVEILTIDQPQLVQQSARVKRHMKELLPKLNLSPSDTLVVELAATLSHIGCISMPTEIMRKVFSGVKLTNDEALRYSQFPQTGARLIGNIPRLEKTAAIIQHQTTSLKMLPFDPSEIEYVGIVLLQLLTAYDLFVSQGMDEEYVISRLRITYPDCPPLFFSALQETLDDRKDYPEQRSSIDALKTGMTLAQDIKLRDGHLLLPKGTELSDNLIELILRFSKQGLLPQKSIMVFPNIFSLV